MLEYFRRRRDLADRSFQMQRRDALVGDEGRLVALTYGLVTIGGVQHGWTTVGLYDVTGQVAPCWLLPLDQRAFDAIWSLGSHTRAIPHQEPAVSPGRRSEHAPT